MENKFVIKYFKLRVSNKFNNTRKLKKLKFMSLLTKFVGENSMKSKNITQ